MFQRVESQKRRWGAVVNTSAMSTQGLAGQFSGLRMVSLRAVAAELAEPNSPRFAEPSGLGAARAPIAPPTALGQAVTWKQAIPVPAPGQGLVRRAALYDMRQLDPSRGFKIVGPGDGLGAAPPMICRAPTGWQTGRLDLHDQDLHGQRAPVRARLATFGPFTVPPTASLRQEMTQGQTASGAMPTQKRKIPTPCDMGVHESERCDMPHSELFDPLRLDKDAAYMGAGPPKRFHDARKKKPDPAAEQVAGGIFAGLVACCHTMDLSGFSGRSEDVEETEETGTMEQCQPDEECPALLSKQGSGLTDDGS